MKDIVILFERGAKVDEGLVGLLEGVLVEAGYSVHVDKHLKISVDWARSVEAKIRRPDAAVVVFSEQSFESEMLCYELEVVNDAKLRNPQMRFVSIPVGNEAAALGTVGPLLGSYQTRTWQDDLDSSALIAELLEHLEGPLRQTAVNVLLGPAGGVSDESPFYIQREGDVELRRLLDRREATTLIKGPRQSGKTSLSAQGIKHARSSGSQILVTDFQWLGSNLHASEQDFFRELAANLAHQLRSSQGIELEWSWNDMLGPTSNLNAFVCELIEATPNRIVWFLDEVDWLFPTSFANSFFALVRYWHNAHTLLSEVSWDRFSVVIAYATEAHLFVQDINQSPFNVGKRIDLKGFTLRQTEALNERYGEPLRGIDQVNALYDLLDGRPFLTRIAFDVLMRSNGNLRALLASADSDDGPFGDHLRRVLISVTQLSTVRDVLKKVLTNGIVKASPGADRLVAAGILAPNGAGNHVIQCKLYRKYLERHLK